MEKELKKLKSALEKFANYIDENDVDTSFTTDRTLNELCVKVEFALRDIDMLLN